MGFAPPDPAVRVGQRADLKVHLVAEPVVELFRHGEGPCLQPDRGSGGLRRPKSGEAGEELHRRGIPILQLRHYRPQLGPRIHGSDGMRLAQIALDPRHPVAGRILLASASDDGTVHSCGTWPLVPVVVDLPPPVPVLAAGGIANGRGLAAALALGAAEALIGTRFQATAEARVAPAITKAIIEGRGQDTERSSVLDIARGSQWPSKYPARTLGHPYLDRWRGREGELVGDSQAKQDYQNQVGRHAIAPLPVWAGEAIDLITDLPSAADLVTSLATQAEDALARAGRR